MQQLACLFFALTPTWYVQTLGVESQVQRWPSCKQEARDPSCFTGTAFSCANCCDTLDAGPAGNVKCWGQGYTYARCCPPCPEAHDPDCFPAGSSQSCKECCDRRHGERGNAACWADKLRGLSFEQCCLGRRPICVGRWPDNFTEAVLQTSQYGQERFMLEWLDCPSSGFYLDLGAYDGEHLSNTHALDVGLAWQGVCVDAVLRPEHFKDRSCRLVQGALHNRSGTRMTFQRFQGHHESAYGRIQERDVPVRHAEEGTGGYDEVLGEWKATHMQTLSVADLLRGLEAEGLTIPKVIDFVSLDVEGAVLAVLQGFPLQRYCVRVWALEVWSKPAGAEGGREALFQIALLLQEYDYVLVQVLGADHIFVHRNDCMRKI